MSMKLKDYNLKGSINEFKLPDYGAAEISQQTYKRNKREINMIYGNKEITYKVIEPIEDPDTGLHGYVLQNEKMIRISLLVLRGLKKMRGLISSSKTEKKISMQL